MLINKFGKLNPDFRILKDLEGKFAVRTAQAVIPFGGTVRGVAGDTHPILIKEVRDVPKTIVPKDGNRAYTLDVAVVAETARGQEFVLPLYMVDANWRAATEDEVARAKNQGSRSKPIKKKTA